PPLPRAPFRSFPTRRSSDLRFLLQRAGAERRGRRAPALALFDRGDPERELERVRGDGPRGRFVLDLGLLPVELVEPRLELLAVLDRKSTRLNSSHGSISYAV